MGGASGAGSAPRLKDVAEAAGVSVKTVSNVVNGTVHVAAATRTKVQAAIDALGYHPNVAARKLRTGRSGVIALAFPELPSPYFAELAVEVIAAARRHGCTVLMDDTAGDPRAELRIASGLGDPMIDGVILSPLGLDQHELAARERQIPLVLLGEADLGLVCDHVHIDNIAAAREAVEHLIAAGRRRIAAIGWQDPSPRATAQQRMAGYRQALAAAGLPAEPALCPPVRAYFRRQQTAAALRAEADLRDPATLDLLAELGTSADFLRLWAKHDARPSRDELKRFVHPEVGELSLRRQALTVGGAEDQVIIVYQAAPGSPSADRLSRLVQAS